MVLIGCKPPGRHTEQHDVFFGIGEKIEDTFEDIKAFWPEAMQGGIHIDAWREVTRSGSSIIEVHSKQSLENPNSYHIFFLNLGGYCSGVFEEFHSKVLIATHSLDEAKRIAKTDYEAFFKKHDSPHIDDKYGIDVDDVMKVNDILPQHLKEKYSIFVKHYEGSYHPDEIHLGYFFLNLKI